MNTFKTLSSCVSLVSLMLLGACGAPESSSLKVTSIPAPQGELPMLGMGYNSLDARVTGTNCFENLPIEVKPAQIAELEFQRNMSADQLSKMLEAGIEIGFPVYPGITVKGRARYAEEFASGRYAETMTLHFKAVGARSRVYFGDDSLGSTDNIKATSRLDKLKKDENLPAIQGMCGDRFISSVEKGMEFTATLKMEFNNEFQRKAYAAGFGAEIVGGVVSIDVDASYEKMLAASNVNVSLAIQQQGGVPVNLLKVIPSKDWADEDLYDKPLNTDPIPSDTAFIPDSERIVMDDLRSGITFLNCSFETRAACYAIFRHISEVAQDLSKQVKNDEVGASQIFENGNLVPVSIQTSAYPNAYGMEVVALGHDSDDELQARYKEANELRRRLLEIYRQTKEIRRRAEAVNLNKENIQVFIGKDEAGAKEILDRYNLRAARLEAAIAKADEILDAVETVEHDCWDAKAMRQQSGIDHCANGVQIENFPDLSHNGVNGLAEQIKDGSLYIDSRDLIGDPESFTEWCYYSYAPTLDQPVPAIFEYTDLSTVDILMAEAKVAKPTEAASLLNQCYEADKALQAQVKASNGVLSLVNRGIYSVRPIASLVGPITNLDLSANQIIDIAPLAKIKTLTRLVLDGNKLKSLAGLAVVQPSAGAISTVSIKGNQISTPVESTLNNPSFRWNNVIFGKNPLTQINQPVNTSVLASLDLRGSVVSNVSGLAGLSSPFKLQACSNRITTCPFEAARCSLETCP